MATPQTYDVRLTNDAGDPIEGVEVRIALIDANGVSVDGYVSGATEPVISRYGLTQVTGYDGSVAFSLYPNAAYTERGTTYRRVNRSGKGRDVSYFTIRADALDTTPNISDFTLHIDNSAPRGIVWDGYQYRVVDASALAVFSYSRDGVYLPDKKFELRPANANPSGIAWNGLWFVVSDTSGIVFGYDGLGGAIWKRP